MNKLTQQVVAAAKGDEQAYTDLVNHTQNLVTSVALSIVKDVRASEEVAQKLLFWLGRRSVSYAATPAFYLGYAK